MIARHFETLLFAGLLSVPLLGAPHATDAAQPERAAVGVVCGEVLASDLFNQTFLLLEQTKAVETVPFSRWTDFVTRDTDNQGHAHVRVLDPTDVRTGDRLCIVLDPSGATANRVEVLPHHSATEIARACAK